MSWVWVKYNCFGKFRVCYMMVYFKFKDFYVIWVVDSCVEVRNMKWF